MASDQAWYWTDEWQAGEREASRQIAVGETTFHDDVDAMFDHLEKAASSDADV